jgi:hypothetical protein
LISYKSWSQCIAGNSVGATTAVLEVVELELDVAIEPADCEVVNLVEDDGKVVVLLVTGSDVEEELDNVVACDVERVS